MKSGFLRRAIGLLGIALDTGAHNVLPCRRAAAVAGDDVIQVQIAPIKDFAAILAGVVVAFEDVVARELHFLLRHAVEEAKENHSRHANAERNRVNAFRMRLLVGEVVPLGEIVGLERAICVIENDLRVAFKKQS